MLDKPRFAIDSPRILSIWPIMTNHAMAGDDNGEQIFTDRGPDGSYCARMSNGGRYGLIAGDRSDRDCIECAPDSFSKWCCADAPWGPEDPQSSLKIGVELCANGYQW